MIRMTTEDLLVFRASRSASPVGAFMRERLATRPSHPPVHQPVDQMRPTPTPKA